MATIDELMSEKEVPVIIADHQGIVTHVNEAFTKTFEWRADDLIDELITTLIPSTLQDAHHLGLSRFVTTGEPTLLNQPLDLEIVTASGRIEKAQHFIVAEKSDG
ncbi:MAG: PAS domain-containing protein, partial [Deltaproteobacteria bacterium]